MITYRANRAGTLQAAYVGTVRVGYVECLNPTFPSPHWRWQLILLRPEGGAYFGKTDTEEDAKDVLLQSFTHWLACAGLQPKE